MKKCTSMKTDEKTKREKLSCSKRSDSRKEKRNYLTIKGRERKTNVYQSEIKMVSVKLTGGKKERNVYSEKGRRYRGRECGRRERECVCLYVRACVCV